MCWRHRSATTAAIRLGDVRDRETYEKCAFQVVHFLLFFTFRSGFLIDLSIYLLIHSTDRYADLDNPLKTFLGSEIRCTSE